MLPLPYVSNLGAGDNFVGGGGEAELGGGGLILFQGFVEVERGEFDFFIPGAVGVEVGAGVDGAVGDGVVGNLVAVSVAEDQGYRGQGCRRRIYWN